MNSHSKADDTCPLCGESVGCGVVAGQEQCWCFDMPASVKKPEGLDKKSCLCRSCLMKMKEADILESPPI